MLYSRQNLNTWGAIKTRCLFDSFTSGACVRNGKFSDASAFCIGDLNGAALNVDVAKTVGPDFRDLEKTSGEHHRV